MKKVGPLIRGLAAALVADSVLRQLGSGIIGSCTAASGTRSAGVQDQGAGR